jgi:hypothetical protein
MRALVLGAALAMLLCTNAGAQIVRPVVHALPVDIENTGEERTTAENGPIILRQLVTYFAFAHVNAPVHVENGNKTYDLTPDDLLFTARTPGVRSLVFCTSRTDAYHGRNFFGSEVHFPVCVMDKDNDGVFDSISLSAPTGGPFSSRTLSFTTNLATPAPYTIARDAPDFRMQIIIKFVPDRGGFGQLQVKFMHDEDEEDLVGMNYAIPRQLPTTTSIFGARIMLLAVGTDGLHYQLLSGMDPRQPHDVDIQHAGASAQPLDPSANNP